MLSAPYYNKVSTAFNKAPTVTFAAHLIIYRHINKTIHRYQPIHMKKTFLFLLFSLLTVAIHAQGYYTKYYADKAFVKEAQDWMNSGAWREGFTAASPHATVNASEFYTQYQKNPEQWKALFSWLAKTDLLALPKGRTPIPGSTLVASVEDDVNRELSQQRSESHHHHIDFQYVVKGTERFGLIDHYTSKINVPYRPDVVHYAYDLQRAHFYDSDPQHFFLFFPGDWHIAKVKTDSGDQHIRVVVVKVDYL